MLIILGLATIITALKSYSDCKTSYPHDFYLETMAKKITKTLVIAGIVAIILGLLPTAKASARSYTEALKDKSVEICVEFAIKQEGFRPTPYQDRGCRIGYGSACNGETSVTRDKANMHKYGECARAYENLSTFSGFAVLQQSYERGVLAYIYTNTAGNLNGFIKRNPKLSKALEEGNYKQIELEIYNQKNSCKVGRELMVFRGHGVEKVFNLSFC